MDFEISPDIRQTLDAIDAFIEREITPLEQTDDNVRFFDHRREYARTDFENGGVPRRDWEELLSEMRRRADAAGWLRHALPAEYGGHDATNLEMAIIREHLATKGLGLHNDLQNESADRGELPDRPHDARLRDRRAARRMDARLPRWHASPRVRAHRAESRFRRDLPRDDRDPRR